MSYGIETGVATDVTGVTTDGAGVPTDRTRGFLGTARVATENTPQTGCRVPNIGYRS